MHTSEALHDDHVVQETFLVSYAMNEINCIELQKLEDIVDKSKGTKLTNSFVGSKLLLLWEVSSHTFNRNLL
jgi:hypothetical protein